MASADAKRILLVDDEQSLLVVMEQYLRRLGYETVACTEGGAAWKSFEQNPGGFSLVLVDLTLSGMPVPELLTRMLQLKPDLLILVCSGYPFDMTTLPAPQSQIGFLQKPFTPRMLSEAIRRLHNGG